MSYRVRVTRDSSHMFEIGSAWRSVCALQPPWQPVSSPRVWWSRPRSRGICKTRPSISFSPGMCVCVSHEEECLCFCIFESACVCPCVCVRQTLTPEHPDTTRPGPPFGCLLAISACLRLSLTLWVGLETRDERWSQFWMMTSHPQSWHALWFTLDIYRQAFNMLKYG